ncbi:dTDP-4-dehydrorhamnose 3,5-epimerase [Flavobacterium akiainvivens]|uniref:dTDP-4-dehydrorhamnose 3,5-epimerase n=1 Tax=Flavobacterium akiainvivens TaxID=1202724 RepID=A0A0M8MB34_9FLAO|nr:dTDP-4-dehydrorhamnose 3,5-epimerase [Flavobacterium akiainvivens]KOS06375.1 dTDP-4-dehydrorhamnose 3,5-epimerase [Flavobacterium akiainvivens]SFQ14887.1 dTDP-4-dehydrorhamnose 3,5-epimerase [Flavobacterium akiainvivens]
MTVTETELSGCYILEPSVHNDERGHFFESYNKEKFKKATGLDINFVQDNQSFSTHGVLRGLHYQVGEGAQAKLVRVCAGAVIDVAVDLRRESATFGKYVAVELSAENKKQLFIPRGFAHGFVVLSNEAEFVYKCDNFYSKKHECGIIYNDPTLNIDWKLSPDDITISPKDKDFPDFNNAVFF